MATTNMGLTLPTVGVTVGPTWATQLNTALTSIDAHDHTTGKGTKVPISGINFNAAINMAGNNFTNIGDTNTDTLTVDGDTTVIGDILPSTTLTRDLGSSSKLFQDAWIDTVDIATIIKGSGTAEIGDASGEYMLSVYGFGLYAIGNAVNDGGVVGHLGRRNTPFFWIKADSTGATSPTYVAADSYNASAIARAGAGTYNITVSTVATEVCPVASLSDNSTPFILDVRRTSTTNIQLRSYNTSGTLTDITSGVEVNVMGIGY